MTYDSPITEVNKIVIDNFANDDFIEGIDKIRDEGYFYAEPISTTAIIIAAIIVGTTTATIVYSNWNARKVRQELVREGYRSQYLKKEELDEIAYLERERLQVMFLNSQSEYIQKEENYKAQLKRNEQEKMVMIVVIGITTVIIASAIMRK